LLGHIYHMINNDSITGHAVKHNRRSSDPKEPVWSAYKEEFEDTKGVIIIRKSKKERQHNGQKKKGQTMIYKTYT